MIHSPALCLILGEMLDLSINVMIHLSRQKINVIKENLWRISVKNTSKAVKDKRFIVAGIITAAGFIF